MGSVKSFLKCHGVYEWLLIRCSAMLILFYLIYFFYFFSIHTSLSYNEWCNFFSNKGTKIFSILALFAILSHAWIGMRHILEDYIKKKLIKKMSMCVIIAMLILYLFFGIIIIWSV